MFFQVLVTYIMATVGVFPADVRACSKEGISAPIVVDTSGVSVGSCKVLEVIGGMFTLSAHL